MSGTLIVVGVLVAAALWLEIRDPPRFKKLLGMRNKHPAGLAIASWRLWKTLQRRWWPKPIDAGLIVIEVATRLRSGVSVDEAWYMTFSRAGIISQGNHSFSGTNQTEHENFGAHPAEEKHLFENLEPVANKYLAVSSLKAASVFTDMVGAPLAEVLEQVAEGIGEASRASVERKVSLAGPRTSARVLSILPISGIVLGWIIGADPAAFLLDGAMGSICLLGGIALFGIGIAWSRRLVQVAERQ